MKRLPLWSGKRTLNNPNRTVNRSTDGNEHNQSPEGKEIS